MLNGKNDYDGVLILQGKPMNFRKNTMSDIVKNKIFLLFKKAIGLHNDPDKTQTPHYHNIIIASDADDDGFHICSLIINMFDRFWPELIQKNYLKFLKTSVVRLTNKKNEITDEFYSFQDFKNFYLE